MCLETQLLSQNVDEELPGLGHEESIAWITTLSVEGWSSTKGGSYHVVRGKYGITELAKTKSSITSLVESLDKKLNITLSRMDREKVEVSHGLDHLRDGDCTSVVSIKHLEPIMQVKVGLVC